MSNVTLSAAVRDSLLSLQNTTNLIERTQGRLSTGLEVASAIDDPVKFFQAKTLSDRASDFDSKKNDIDQGISTVTAALDATEAVEDIVAQLKGLALSAKSATSSQIGELVSQFNDLRTQINNLTADAEYQGLNLVNGTGSTLTVQFSNETTSTLSVASVDLRAQQGLGIEKAVTAKATTGQVLNFSYARVTNTTLSGQEKITLTYAGETAFTLGNGSGATTYTFSYGGNTFTITVSSGGNGGDNYAFSGGAVLSAGKAITLTIQSAGNASGSGKIELAGGSITASETDGVRVLDKDFTTQVSAAITDLESALTTLRTKSQNLGSNVALLQTRLEFTETYVNTLQAGSDKLTLADLNEEGANLLALQTRQQLGIQALSFAGQAEQGILGLFR
ncbi:flagellin [Terasakiella sp. A23]|uniref:flagellin n=1 Tax=Terasakiella sp. FCG-A23 TaxID=3080561 RepID=UPI00295460B4|nr:flagellin [Terasakiella sp. A23]MDV7339038.1 flagellin [Terasakiella sp. A23]